METSVRHINVWVMRSLIVSVSPIVTFASRFVRNVILSRLLIPDQFGTAIAISVVIGLAGLVTDVGLDRFVMVNKSTQALSAAHVILILRGCLLALLLVGTAPWTAELFGISQFTSSFALAGVVPFVGGFAHLGIKRIMTDYNYGRESIAQLISNLAAIAAIFIAVMILHDHRAIIVGFVAESFFYVVLTHLLAHAPYRLQTDRETLKEALSFGLPLTLNGIALATISQVDRVMVGHLFGVAILGFYAVILNMALTPVSMILRVFGSLGLPYMIRAREDTSVTSENYHLLAFVYSTVALLYAFFVVLTLDILTPYIFGARFNVAPSLNALITVMVFLRVQRGGAPTLALLSTGQTGELALLNLTGAIGLLCAFGLVFLWPRLNSIVLGVVIGDFIGLAFFFFVSSPARAASRTAAITNIAISFFALAIIVGAFLWMPEVTWRERSTVFLVGLFGIVLQLSFGLAKHQHALISRLRRTSGQV
jgi:O-antigen/teichoic acid export membrane protein